MNKAVGLGLLLGGWVVVALLHNECLDVLPGISIQLIGLGFVVMGNQ